LKIPAAVLARRKENSK